MRKNRLGLTSFIDDRDKISAFYEKALKDPSIDSLDHLIIALVDELGKQKEEELKEVKENYNKLLTALSGVFETLDDMPVDIAEILDEEYLKVINGAELY